MVQPGLRDRGGGLHGGVGGDADQVRPGPRDHVDELVAAPAEGEPAPVAVLVGEVVEHHRRRALAVHGHPQVRERVEHVGVAAVLGDEDLRADLAHDRADDRVEGPQPAGVAGARGQRDVDRGALAPGPPTSVG